MIHMQNKESHRVADKIITTALLCELHQSAHFIADDLTKAPAVLFVFHDAKESFMLKRATHDKNDLKCFDRMGQHLVEKKNFNRDQPSVSNPEVAQTPS